MINMKTSLCFYQKSKMAATSRLILAYYFMEKCPETRTD